MKLMSTILAIAVLAFAVPAAATHWEDFAGVGDCAGWHMDGLIKVASSLDEVMVAYTVTLSQAGAVLDEQSGELTVPSTNSAATPFSGGAPWAVEPCGAVVVTGIFTILDPNAADPERRFESAFLCDCGGGDACHYTPGYWKNHEEAWPVTELTLGGVSYDQTALLWILRMPVRGDATIITAHHLIAAKLNVLNGADDGIQGRIDEADDLLAIYPLFSRPGNPGKRDLLSVKDALADYNEMGCGGLDFADKAMNEDVNFGDLKSRYR